MGRRYHREGGHVSGISSELHSALGIVAAAFPQLQRKWQTCSATAWCWPAWGCPFTFPSPWGCFIGSYRVCLCLSCEGHPHGSALSRGEGHVPVAFFGAPLCTGHGGGCLFLKRSPSGRPAELLLGAGQLGAAHPHPLWECFPKLLFAPACAFEPVCAAPNQFSQYSGKDSFERCARHLINSRSTWGRGSTGKMTATGLPVSAGQIWLMTGCRAMFFLPGVLQCICNVATA